MVYIWLSNENPSSVEVYFDNFKVTHTKSPIVQQNDYYAFGLICKSSTRENAMNQNHVYNDKEFQDELDLGWLDYGMRMCQPELGRWTSIDPLTEKYYAITQYAYVINNPVALVDPNEAEIWLSFTYTNEDGNEVTTRC